ncbi:MAG: ribbon-helix-helix domain-containing protein [Capsulimonadaceae bacterium]
MNATTISISLDEELLNQLDRLVQSRVFPDRSQAIQSAVEEKVAQVHRNQLAEECSKLDPAEEMALADLGLAAEVDEWPPY